MRRQAALTPSTLMNPAEADVTPQLAVEGTLTRALR